MKKLSLLAGMAIGTVLGYVFRDNISDTIVEISKKCSEKTKSTNGEEDFTEKDIIDY